MYPVYCCWFAKAVVQVPTGGCLNFIVMLPSTGDGILIIFESGGGGNCAAHRQTRTSRAPSKRNLVVSIK